MAGSGLRSLLEQIYPANAVTHMMTGKAHERAFRGHMLVDAALNTMLANNSFGTLTTIMTHSLENSNGEPVNDSYDRGADVEPGDGLKNGRRKEVQTGGTPPLEDGERSISDEGTSVNLLELQGVFDSLIIGEMSVESATSKGILGVVEKMMRENDAEREALHA